MSKSHPFEKPEFNLVSSTRESDNGSPVPGTPFRILMLGDWSGRRNRGVATSRSNTPRPVAIDRDNFDEVLARLNVSLAIPIGDRPGQNLDLRFRELDDFHPDRLFRQLHIFEALRRTRERLLDTATFADAAREVRAWMPEAAKARREEQTAVASPASAVVNRPPLDLSGGGLLDQMLDAADSSPLAMSPAAATPDDLNALLQRVVAPHLTPKDDPQRDELVASVDEATSRLMRAILHHPDFQSLEAAWRGLYFLTSRLETGEDLRLFLFDVTRDDLAAMLGTAEDLEATAIYKRLVGESTETLGAEPWALMGGDYIFGQTRNDIAMLSRIGQLAEAMRAPFIAGASSTIVGCNSFASTPDPSDWQLKNTDLGSQAWDLLRQTPEAGFIGLALPRVLFRLPYGASTEPVEAFDFEEMTEGTPHTSFLWGNPAFACIYLIGRAFTDDGWDMRPGSVQDIDDLPLYTYSEDGSSEIKPCAEVLFTQRAASRLIDRGLMPVLSFKGSDRVRVGMFQSLATPPRNLAGRWSQTASLDE